MFHKFTSHRSQSRKSKRNATSLRGTKRRAMFEPLESRNLLSVTLPTISTQTLLTGAPLNIPLASTGTTNPVSYTVSVNNSNVTATVPTSNTFLKLHVQDTADGINGDMVFELFNDLAPNTVAKITDLVTNRNFYNGLTFHRIIKDFMIQGGDPTGSGSGGPGSSFDDEFNSKLQFTSSGILAMANSGNDTNGSQFFITAAPYRYGDFKYTIFGMLVEGDNIRNAINNVATNSSDHPNHTVTITSASIITAPADGVLRLSAPIGTTGSATVTVKATDTVTNETSEQHFTVNLAADTNNDPPFLNNTLNSIQTTVNTQVPFNISATDVEGDSIYYDAEVSPANPNLTLIVNHSTGAVTLTPSSSLAPGVYSIKIKAAASAAAINSADTQMIPVYINPAAPMIQLAPGSDTNINNDNITSLNNTSGKTLQFNLSGLVTGADVQIYADNTLIGQATATGATMTIPSNGTFTLTDGSHIITAKQTLRNKEVKVGNVSKTTDLASATSSSLNITVDSTAPNLSFTPITTASAGIQYNCQATVIGDIVNTITFSLPQAPNGMTVSNTGLITWTPASGTTGTVDVTLQATDRAGNSSQSSYQITLVPPNNPPVLTAASPSLGTTDENTPLLIALSSFINHGTGSTLITDADSTTVVGGIALTSLTGNGTWEYTLDGTNFHTIVSVSASSALLLPQNASLRYTPDGKNGENPTITYRAWDTTSGMNGSRGDVSQDVLVGGHTAFSTATDTATLTVNPLNDSPVLTPANPSMGTADIHAPKVISLSGTFLNHGTGSATITDVDANAVVGGIAIYGVTGIGTWEYSLDGTTFTAIGTVSNAAALLLPKTASLRYTPDGSTSETPTISYRAWDTTTGTNGAKVDLSANGTTGDTTAFSSATDVAKLTVIDVNDAPVLAPANPSLGTTNEDTAKIIPLSGTFINNGSGTSNITDPDTSAVVGGIAMVGMAGTGKWEYSLDGTTFVTIVSVSDASALLLPKTATLRYTPKGANGETATITYRAWDTSSGTAGGRADLSQTSALGTTTAFSLVKDKASLTVTDVNDAPVLTPAHPPLGTIAPGATKTISLTGTFINLNSGSTTITDVDTNAVVGGIAITGISGGGTWQYSLDSTTFTSIGTISDSSALLLPKTASLRYTAGSSLTDTPSITYRGWDTTGSGVSGNKVDLSATSAVGGATAFSSATDTATLTVAGGSISGFVYVDANNDGLRTTSNGGTHYGLPGVPVKLLINNSGTWTEVAGKSPVLTGADGSYHFTNLIAGTYRIQEVSPTNYTDGKDTAGNVGGTTKGTVGTDTIDVTLAGGDNAAEYNFGELGLRPEKISLRMFLASSPVDEGAITQMNVAPTIDLSAAASGSGYSTSIKSNGATVAVAATDATVADRDSSMLASMTLTLGYSPDGSSEVLAADVSNTSITSNYANGVLTLSGAASVSDYQKVLRTVTYKNTAASPHAGVRTINVVANDGITNSLAAISSISVSIGPSGYSITANDSQINSTDAANTAFTFAGATIGTTYNYKVTSSGSTTPVTGSGTITSATQSITGINVSSLADGTLTYSVTLTDSAGNVGSAMTATATLDRSAPSGYTITPNDAFLNATDAVNTGFTFAGAEKDATYTYRITSSVGTAEVTGNGTINLPNQQVTGINVSTLSEGTLTYSVTLTDPAGNAGTPKTTTAVWDKTPPTGYSITPNDTLLNAADAANTGFTFAGAEQGATYSYTITSDGGDGQVTGSGTLNSPTDVIHNINVTSLPNGTLTFKVKLTDPSGNVGPEVTCTTTLEKSAPTGYSITVSDGNISAAESTHVGFTFAGAEANTTYTYTITSDGGGDPVTNTGNITVADQQISNIDISSLHEGNLTFSVTLKDAAGNIGAPATATAILDKTVPTGYSITANDQFIDAAKATNTGFTFAGAESGATYTYTITSSGGGSVTHSGPITEANQHITGIDVSSLPEGLLTFSVTLTDVAGNVGTAAIATATWDKTPPSGYTITLDDDNINATDATNFGFTFAGAEQDSTYTYTITSDGGGDPITHSDTITSATQHVTGINISSLHNGNLTVSVTLKDPTGNVGTPAIATAVLDKTAPTDYSITLDDSDINATEATNFGFTIAGAEANSTYTYTITSDGGGIPVTNTDNITSATQHITGIDISSLHDGHLTISVTLKDQAGNTGTAATATATLDKTAPTDYSITVDDNNINAAEAPNFGFTFAGAEVGATYTYTITSDGGGTPITNTDKITSATQQITGIDLSSLSDGHLTISVTLKDPSGNTGTAATATATLDMTAPTGYTIIVSPSVVPLDNQMASVAFTNAEKGATYEIVVSTSGGLGTKTFQEKITAVDQVIDNLDISTLTGGTLTFTVSLTDEAGNKGPVLTSTITKPLAGSQAAVDHALNQTEDWLLI